MIVDPQIVNAAESETETGSSRLFVSFCFSRLGLFFSFLLLSIADVREGGISLTSNIALACNERWEDPAG